MKALGLVRVFLAAILSMAIITGTVIAQEKKSIKGIVRSIDLISNTAVVSTYEPKEDVAVLVEDKPTLDKFKDGRISAGDEVTVKYIIRDGKNVSTYFRKSAGC